MKIEEIKELLLSFPTINIRDIDNIHTVIEAINHLEADKLEMAKVIVNNYRRVELATLEELQGGVENLSYRSNNHDKNCIVNKANKYIKEVEK